MPRRRRPMARPASVPPLPAAQRIADGWRPPLAGQLVDRPDVSPGTEGVAAAFRNDVVVAGRRVRHEGDAVAVLRRADETHFGADEAVQLQIAGGRVVPVRRRGGPQEQDRAQPQLGGGDGGGPAVIALDAAAGQHPPGAAGPCVGQQVLQLAHLVPGQRCAGQVVTLHPYRPVRTEGVDTLDRRGQPGQLDPRRLGAGRRCPERVHGGGNSTHRRPAPIRTGTGA